MGDDVVREVVDRGFDRSYPTLTRLIRNRGLRPACEACRPAKGRAVAVIEHPPGEEIQWDWLELPNPPTAWGWTNLKTTIVMTTNRGVAAWGDVLGDTTVAAAMLVRLLHRSVVMNLDGDSYRLRDHHARSNTFRRSATGRRQPLT